MCDFNRSGWPIAPGRCGGGLLTPIHLTCSQKMAIDGNQPCCVKTFCNVIREGCGDMSMGNMSNMGNMVKNISEPIEKSMSADSGRDNNKVRKSKRSKLQRSKFKFFNLDTNHWE